MLKRLTQCPLASVLTILASLLCVTAWTYWRGLHSPFLLDDYANLSALNDFGGVRNWETFKLFVFGNESGPMGRPVAMLSFLIHDRNWPASPWAFKFINLVIHLCNGALLYALTLRISNIITTNQQKTALWVATITAGIWLLHPLHVSTVLYAVQRMAVLSAFFVLAGLLAYIHGRQLLSQSRTHAYVWMSIGMIIGTLLAMLSKENGALLPLLALCLEITVLHRLAPAPTRRWQAVFLWSPALMLTAYFTYGLIGGDILAQYENYRDFTLTERILTQPRILIDYLYHLYIPRIISPGLMTQDFLISTSWRQPLTTLPTIILIIGLLAAAIKYRVRYPLYSLAVLFYFTGHLIESTIIPLEMYFEHRNYLPSAFLFLPVAVGLAAHIQKFRIRLSAMLILLLIPTFLTAVRADIWSNEELLAYHWAGARPESRRALRHAAIVAANYGRYETALTYIDKARNILPNNDAMTVLHWLGVVCHIRPVSVAEEANALAVMRQGSFPNSFDEIRTVLSIISLSKCQDTECKAIGWHLAHQLVNALLRHDTAKTRDEVIYELILIKGELYLREKKFTQAVKHFRLALQTLFITKDAIHQVRMLATAGEYQTALEHIDYIDETMPNDGWEELYRDELHRLKNIILEDKNNSSL